MIREITVLKDEIKQPGVRNKANSISKLKIVPEKLTLENKLDFILYG